MIRVAVSGDDDQLVLLTHCRSNRGDDVIAFEPGNVQRGDSGSRQQLSAHHIQLGIQRIGLLFSLRLVFRCGFVTKRFLFAVKHHNNGIRVVVFHQGEKHRTKSEHSIGDLAASGGHRVGQCKIGTVDKRIAIQRHYFHAGGTISPFSTDSATLRMVERLAMAVC